MNYQPHELRVIKEQIDLDIKLLALDAFFLTGMFKENTPARERSLLLRQADIMCVYSALLGERINLFKCAA